MDDGASDTAWRCDGDGVNQTIVVSLRGRSLVSQVGLIPGYAKTDSLDGTDRFVQNGRISAVRYGFDGGAAQSQSFDVNNRSGQTMRLDQPVATSTIRITILGSVPGSPSGIQQPVYKVAISELFIS